MKPHSNNRLAIFRSTFPISLLVRRRRRNCSAAHPFWRLCNVAQAIVFPESIHANFLGRTLTQMRLARATTWLTSTKAPLLRHHKPKPALVRFATTQCRRHPQSIAQYITQVSGICLKCKRFFLIPDRPLSSILGSSSSRTS